MRAAGGRSRSRHPKGLRRRQLQLLSLKAWQEQVSLIGTDFEGEDFQAGYSTSGMRRWPRSSSSCGRGTTKAKTVVWAANIHVARAPAPNGVRPMGGLLVAAKLGRDYVSFALAAYRSKLQLVASCEVREGLYPINRSRAHDLGEDALLVDLAKSSYLRPASTKWAPSRSCRASISTGRLLETSERMQALAWPPCQP